MLGIKNLLAAKIEKNNRFFTLYEDIEKELKFYSKECFKNKVVYCNCDTDHSNFYKYFVNHFERLELKKLIITGIADDWDYFMGVKDGKAYKIEYYGKEKGAVKTEIKSGSEKFVAGDFRSKECVEFLAACDIVITNPPFSRIAEFFSLLVKYDKKFLVLAPITFLIRENFFALFKNNQCWFGATRETLEFEIPSYGKVYSKKNTRKDPNQKRVELSNCRWLTNLEMVCKPKFLDLNNNYYSPKKYLRYKEVNAINVDKTSEIPCDYSGFIGVPITFMDKYCPEQFEIIGLLKRKAKIEKGGKVQKKFSRIIIKNKFPKS